jgi:hypothetical protein
MNDELKAVFDGALLSDGSFIQSSRISSYFSMSLSASHEDWILSIAEFFTKNGVEYKISRSPGKTRISKGKIINEKPSVRITTPCYRNLLSERQRWYPNGIKIVPSCLDLRNPMILAGWFMGDGNTSLPRVHNTHVHLHTQCFSRNDVQLLVSKLSEVGLSFHMRGGKKKEQFILTATRLDAEKFIERVKDFVTPSFSYKLKCDKWVAPICQICEQTINTTENFKKYCDLCVPKAVLNLRRSRANNAKFNIIRKMRRAVASGRVSGVEFLNEYQETLRIKASIAEQRKAIRSQNREAWEQMVSSHKWPTSEKLAEFLELTSISEIAKAIGVSVSCVAQKCKKLGLRTKPPEYWTWRERVKAKDLVY